MSGDSPTLEHKDGYNYSMPGRSTPPPTTSSDHLSASSHHHLPHVMETKPVTYRELPSQNFLEADSIGGAGAIKAALVANTTGGVIGPAATAKDEPDGSVRERDRDDKEDEELLKGGSGRGGQGGDRGNSGSGDGGGKKGSSSGSGGNDKDTSKMNGGVDKFDGQYNPDRSKDVTGAKPSSDEDATHDSDLSRRPDEDDDACVKCLYYTIQCCECTIT